MSFVDILFIILIIVIVVGFLVFYLRSRYKNDIDELDERKEEILNVNIADQLFTLKNMELSGQTKRKYESLNATWQTITNFKLTEIDSAIVGAKTYIDNIRIIQAKSLIDETKELMDDTYNQVQDLDQELKLLLAVPDENAEKHEQLLERYNEARKSVMNHSFDYGPAIETLEKNLQYLELNFTRYNELTAEGDHLEAQDMLSTIESDLDSLETIIEKIPEMYDTIKNDYEDSLADLRSGYQKMVEEKYRFETDNIPEQIDEIQEDLNKAKTNIKNADLKDAQTMMDKADRDIDSLYDYLGAEVEAKQYVLSHLRQLRTKFDAVTENNHYATIEVDRISQNYILHEDQPEQIKEYQQQIAQEYNKMVQFNDQLDSNEVVYSQLAKEIDKVDRHITEIDESQTDIVKSLSNLSKEEKDAKSNLDLYELDMRNMKRRLEKQNLPGLSEMYYDLFYRVTDQIEYLASQLNQVRVDMREIATLEYNLEEDMNRLEEKTEEILDNAILTEYMIQHSNRFRYEYPEMDDAIVEAEYLFYEQFRYDEALNVIEKALYRVDQDGPTQVRRMYRQEKEHRIY
ncbi:septation ring formation regulator EzrA [Aerococcaceae bacterium DSM 111020]|nr:septation ring formation regulator EzrA [Aerococcaceae bacterium DSM 111020]